MLRQLSPLSLALAIGFSTLLCSCSQADQSDKSVLRQKFEGWQLEFYRNSDTLSQALGINASGSIFGTKEQEKIVIRNVPFYCGPDGCQDMPLPKGFTNVEPNAISDTEQIVGRATKAIGSGGSLRAIIWTPKRKELTLLPVPEGDELTDATDISADGKRITGYATGPERLRPVVWEWDAEKGEYQVEVLSTVMQNNPYLMSSQLIISPDGQTIAGCCTEAVLDNGIIDSSLYAWNKVDGQWQRRLVTQEQMHVKAMNNQGHIVGSVAGSHGRLPCVIHASGTVNMLALPDQDVSGEAQDINEQSIIVGWTDDPPEADGGPVPCTWTLDGNVTPLKLSPSGFGMLFGINDHGQIAGTADVITSSDQPDAATEEAAMLAVRITKDK